MIESIESVGLTHVGFKDVGVDRATLHELHRRIKASGATSYMEVVSTTPEDCLSSARGLDPAVKLIVGLLVLLVSDLK